MDAPIAVTGATGGIGGRVAQRLADRGLSQRLIVRDESRAPQLAGAEVSVATYDEPDTMRRALDGMQTMLFVSGHEHADRVALHRGVVEAAKAAGVERIVYTSLLSAAPDATFTYARDHFHTEVLIKGMGIAHTFLRDSLYLDFVPYLVGKDGAIRGPAADGRFAPVTRDDIADVAVEALLDPLHDGATYDLTGPALVTMAELAGIVTEATGRAARFHNETIDEAYASRASYGAPQWEVDGWVSTYTAIANGEFAVVSDDVERVTGHPPMGIEEFLRASAGAP